MASGASAGEDLGRALARLKILILRQRRDCRKTGDQKRHRR
jgi:hypothetical protein